MSKSKHKFNVDQTVNSLRDEETVKILQKRIENGHICYACDNGKTINEEDLKELPNEK